MAGRRLERRRAVILDVTKLAEQDLIVTMMDSEGEQVRAVAKGARKPGSRLAARTELFLEVDIMLSWGRGLPLITEAQITKAHAGARDGLERLGAASAMAEVCRLTCNEHMADPYLFQIFDRALDVVGEVSGRAATDLVVAAYAVKVLSHVGWRPELYGCVACGEVPVTRVSAVAGGVICDSCARDVAGAEPVSEAQLGWLRALVGATFDTLLSTPIDNVTAAYLLDFVHTWATTHLETRLRAWEFYSSFAW